MRKRLLAYHSALRSERQFDRNGRSLTHVRGAALKVRRSIAAIQFLIRSGVIAVILSSCLLVVAQTQLNATSPITSALRAGKFDEALLLIQPELARDPRNPQLWTLRAIAVSGKGDKKEGLESFRRALSFSPDYLPALEGAAQMEYESGSTDAVPRLEHILKLRPGDQTTHAMLATLAYKRRDCTTAAQHFEQSGTLINSQPEALQDYGTCLLRLKRTEKAIAVFNRALAQPNADSRARLRLASAQLMAERPKDAISTLQPLLQKNPTDADVLELAASAYEADGNTPDAVRVLRQAIVANPHNINLYIDFADLSMDHRSYPAGVAMVNAGLAAEPKSPELYTARGILYVQVSDFDKAEADFAKADELSPRKALGSAALGLATVQKKGSAPALEILQSKLAAHPNDPTLLYLQADILSQRGLQTDSPEFQLALESAKKAVALGPSLAPAHDVLAKLYLQADQKQAAIQQYRAALNIDPQDETALYRLIMALRDDEGDKTVPQLLKQLADLKAKEAKKYIERSHYNLVEEKPPSVGRPQP